jgi:hypothetical protein
MLMCRCAYQCMIWVYVCACVDLCVHTFICLCIYLQTRKHAYIYMCVRARARARVYINDRLANSPFCFGQHNSIMEVETKLQNCDGHSLIRQLPNTISSLKLFKQSSDQARVELKPIISIARMFFTTANQVYRSHRDLPFYITELVRAETRLMLPLQEASRTH